MTLNTYLGCLWVVAAATLGIWALASALTYVNTVADRTRARLLLTLALGLTAFVAFDIARLRFSWSVAGVPPNLNAGWIAFYRTVWCVVLIWCTWVLYAGRFRAWLGRGTR